MTETDPPNDWPGRAVVVIHGIGVQAPRATLDSFVAGLATVGPKLVRSSVRVPVPFDEPLPPDPARMEYRGERVDVYEVYWAPEASRQTSAHSVLGWILRLTFVPGSKARRLTLKTLYDALFLAVSVLLVILLLVGTFLTLATITNRAACPREGAPNGHVVVLAPRDIEEFCPQVPRSRAQLSDVHLGFTQWIFNLRHLAAIAEVIFQSLPVRPDQWQDRTVGELFTGRASAVVGDLTLFDLVVVALIVWLTAQVLVRMWRVLGSGRFLQRVGAGAWLGGQVVVVVALTGALGAAAIPVTAAVGLVLGRLRRVVGDRPDRPGSEGSGAGSRFQRRARRLLQRFNTVIVLTGLGVLLVLTQQVESSLVAFGVTIATTWAILRILRAFLTESVGDVQVYTTEDPNSPYSHARAAVMARAEGVMKTVAKRGYTSIVLVGHSLGAVIAFDTLQRLRLRLPDLTPRVDTLVTIGSALEKVWHFLTKARRGVGSGPVDLSQPLEEPGRRLEDLERGVALVGDRAWLNLWYWNDVVADPITSFGSDPERAARYSWRKVEDRLPELFRESCHRLVVNVRSARFRIWPHSDYWSDRYISRVMVEAIFPERRGSPPV